APFEGEVPALAIAPQPDRRLTDKVLRLAEHRPVPVERGLSSLERSAFREIGERLKKDSVADRPDPAAPAASEAGTEPDSAAPEKSAPLAPATEAGRLVDGDVAARPPAERPGSLLKYAVPDGDTAADDSMAAADFADAREDQTLPLASPAPAGEGADTPQEQAPGRSQDESAVALPHPPSPPLRSGA